MRTTILFVVVVAVLADAAPSGKELQPLRRTVSVRPPSYRPHTGAQQPQQHEAGLSSAPKEGARSASLRVVDGNAALEKQLPWMALITMDNTALCGGSVISDLFVLTAAQCAGGYNQFLVQVGMTDRTYPGLTSTYHYAYTYKSIIHENYEEEYELNDIGLIQLLRPLKFNDGVMPIKLPTAVDVNNNYEGATAQISGWGSTESRAPNYALKYVEQPIMTNERCARFFVGLVKDTNICGDGEGEIGACGIDVGGPLVTKLSDGTWMQIGISSYESDIGCTYSYPSVYTRVTKYIDWIANNTKLQP